MTEHHIKLLQRQFAHDPQRLAEVLAREAAHAASEHTDEPPPAKPAQPFNWLILIFLSPLLLLVWVVVGLVRLYQRRRP